MDNANKIDANINDVINAGRSAKRKKRIQFWLILIVVIAAAFTANGFLHSSEKTKELPFKTEPVRKGDLTVIVTATGTLEPTNQVEIGSEVSGILESVDVDYNSKVTANQILAKLDTSKLEAQVTQSKAALETAQADVLQANATLMETESKLSQYKKVRELSGGKVPSQTDYDSAEASYGRAKANVLSAHAAVSKAEAVLSANETDLSKAIIRSPINGIVLTREVEKGQTVAASFETPILFTIAEDLTQMELHVNVDEADIGQVEEGQKATFTVDAYPNRTFNAVIQQIRYGAEMVDGVVTYETVLKVDNSDLLLRPSMTATADIIVLKVENVVIVSNSALRFEMPTETEPKGNRGVLNAILPFPQGRETKQSDQSIIKQGEHTIWTMKDGVPEPVLVITGVTDGVNTEIVNGKLEPGTEVITGTLATGIRTK